LITQSKSTVPPPPTDAEDGETVTLVTVDVTTGGDADVVALDPVATSPVA
jgi:hypothetical protein